METEKSHNPQSAICKLETQEISGVIHAVSEGLRTRVASGVNPNPRAVEDENR